MYKLHLSEVSHYTGYRGPTVITSFQTKQSLFYGNRPVNIVFVGSNHNPTSTTVTPVSLNTPSHETLEVPEIFKLPWN